MAEQEDPVVPAEVVRSVLQSAERLGYDAAPLVRLVSDDRRLAGLASTVPWTDLIEVVDAFGAEHGQDALNQVARDVAVTLPGVRVVANLMLPPRGFFRVLFRLATRAEGFRLKVDENGQSVSLSVEMNRRNRASPALLQAAAQFLAALGPAINLPELEPEVKATNGHTLKATFALPKGKGVQLRATDGQLDAMVAELVARDQARRPAGAPTVAQLESRFGLTRAESRVVRRLVMGHSLAAIAKELGVGSETVRTHAKRAMQKTDTHRQAELVALVLRDGVPVTPDDEE